MNTTKVSLSTSQIVGDSNITQHIPDVLLKGNTNLVFDLTGIDESSYKVNAIKFNFGDTNEIKTFLRPVVINYKTHTIFNEIMFNKVGTICVQYSNDYTPSTNTYFTNLTAQCICFFENFTTLTFNIPIKIAQNSFYDEIDELKIIDTQLIPDSRSSTIMIVDQQKSGFTNVITVGKQTPESVPPVPDLPPEPVV